MGDLITNKKISKIEYPYSIEDIERGLEVMFEGIKEEILAKADLALKNYPEGWNLNVRSSDTMISVKDIVESTDEDDIKLGNGIAPDSNHDDQKCRRRD